MMDTMALIEQAHKGDKSAREALVENNLGLVHCIVRRFMGRGYEAEDLFQIGSIGLMKSIDKFDLTFGVKFSTYAIPMITGEIKRFLRDDGIIKMSRSIKEAALKVKIAKGQLMQQLGREPTLEETAAKTELPMETIIMALETGQEVESIYKTIYQGDGSAIALVDRLPEEKDANESLINKMIIKDLLKDLQENEREIIIMRYFYDKTQTEIANKLGISQVQVSRLEKKILRSMRARLEN